MTALVFAAGLIVGPGVAAGDQAPVVAANPFAPAPDTPLIVPGLPDDELGALLTALDSSVSDLAARPDAGEASRTTLWSFARRLQSVRLTADQETHVLGRLEQIGKRHPELAPALDDPRRMVSTLTIGKVAPDIVGRDLDGKELQLSDYRDRVVVLVFSASWCAICRSQYPYQRFLQELYDTWPFAILGVDGSASTDAAARAKAGHSLRYRSWWDAPTPEAPDGPIAASWNVRGRPTVYVLDGQGVIRFVDLRYEDLLKSVRQLLNEHMLSADRAAGAHR